MITYSTNSGFRADGRGEAPQGKFEDRPLGRRLIRHLAKDVNKDLKEVCLYAHVHVFVVDQQNLQGSQACEHLLLSECAHFTHESLEVDVIELGLKCLGKKDDTIVRVVALDKHLPHTRVPVHVGLSELSEEILLVIACEEI